MDAGYFLSKYKKGDFVVFDHFITIFDGLYFRSVNNTHTILWHAIYSMYTGYVSVHLNGNVLPGIGCIETYPNNQVRPATNKEKKVLLTAMHTLRNVRWNETTMCIEHIANFF